MFRRMVRRTVRRVVSGGAVLLLVGSVAYRLGQHDAQKVEQHAGRPVEQMDEAELKSAIVRTGVKPQPLTAADEQAAGAADRQDPEE